MLNPTFCDNIYFGLTCSIAWWFIVIVVVLYVVWQLIKPKKVVM